MKAGNDNVNGNEKLFSQIIAGEGKTLIYALDAAMVALEGSTVDICTSTQALAQAGLQEFNSFFNLMGVPTGSLTVDSSLDEYQLGTVYYSEIGPRVLFETRLAQSKKTFKRTLRMDEVDYMVFDNVTHYRDTLAPDVDKTITDTHLSDAWIYKAINEFLKIQGILPQHVINDEDVRNLRDYLENISFKNPHQVAQLEAIQNPALKKWIISAQGALDVLENTDFVVAQVMRQADGEQSPWSVAHILDKVTKRPLVGPQWDKGMHQFLHTLLNNKYEQQIEKGLMPPFIIDPEVEALTAFSSKNFIDRFDSFWNVTGTLGSHAEMVELAKEFGATFARMPKHHRDKLDQLEPILATDNNEANLAIARFVEEAHRSGRPVLIHAKSIEKAEEIATFLKQIPAIKKYVTVWHAANMDNQEQQHIIEAGENQAITVSTLFARGTDIEITHSEGLLSIFTSPDDLREYEQAAKRAGRYDSRGQAILITDRTQFLRLDEQASIQ